MTATEPRACNNLRARPSREIALPDAERTKLFQHVWDALQPHMDTFHKGYTQQVWFAAPGGGGWEVSHNYVKRYEKEEE